MRLGGPHFNFSAGPRWAGTPLGASRVFPIKIKKPRPKGYRGFCTSTWSGPPFTIPNLGRASLAK